MAKPKTMKVACW